jgi:Calcium-activated chloride channel
LKQIAFYHGIQNGLYFGFLVTFTSFLIPLGVLGLAAFLYNLKDRDKNRTFLPLTVLVTCIWMVIFLESWKRKEKLLAYNYDVLGEEIKEVDRRGHEGKYTVDKITGEVVAKNVVSTLWRRIFMEVPIFIIAVSTTIVITLLLASVNERIDRRKNNGTINSR